MRRREFIAALGLAASLPLAARAKDGVRLVGMLLPVPEQDPRIVKYNAAFLDRLRQLGYIDGKTIQIHWRYAGGVLDRLPGLARELVALKVDVIVALAVAASLAAREATTTIPVVMVHAGNPIGAGLIKSLSEPGGNVTGLDNTRLGQQADRAAASGGAVGAPHRIPVEPDKCWSCAVVAKRCGCRPTARA